MATIGPCIEITLPTGAQENLASYQYYFVGSGGVRALSTRVCLGVLMNKPTSGEALRVATFGSVTKARAGGTITAYQHITCNASASVEAITTSGSAVGIALTACASGGTCEILFTGPRQVNLT